MVQLRFFALVLVAGCATELALAEEVSDAQIEKFVAQLASPNKAPRIVIPVHPDYDPKFDHEGQKKVCAAWHKLRDLAPRSFPFLFDHFSDDRYALTEDAGDFYKNYSVGFLCRDILVSNLHPDVWDHKEFGTAFRRRPHQPDYVEHFKLLEPKSAREWYRTRTGLSLRELQIEVVEWVLQEEERLTKTYTNEDREAVRRELTELKASREPRRPSYPFAK
ncbi:MAG: hypothetical protein ABR915_21200 [Thermoguttaceae bacterium]|jgi:hypothetical protein